MFLFKSVKWKIQSHDKIPHVVDITPFFENQIGNPNPNLKQNQNQNQSLNKNKNQNQMENLF